MVIHNYLNMHYELDIQSKQSKEDFKPRNLNSKWKAYAQLRNEYHRLINQGGSMDQVNELFPSQLSQDDTVDKIRRYVVPDSDLILGNRYDF